MTSVGGTTYTYDNNGNVTAIGSLDYTWDWRNRLASAERTGGDITSYGYDHAGQRVFQATGSATTSYPNRYYNVASSSLTATTTKHIFSPDGMLLATMVGSGASTASTTYLHPDHLGDTNVATDENGEVLQTLDYYPSEPPHCRAQILVHRLEQLPQDDGRHLDGYPLRAIPVHPPAADHIPSSAGRCRGVG